MSTSLSFLLDPAVRQERVQTAVRSFWRGRERADHGLCLGLRRLFRDQVHRGKGRGRFVAWMEPRFGIPANLAGLFSWLGSRLENSHLEPFCEGTPALLEFLRKHCATCNDLIKSGALRVVGIAPYERYYNADGDFLGFGYWRRNSHVGTSGASGRSGEEVDPPESEEGQGAG